MSPRWLIDLPSAGAAAIPCARIHHQSAAAAFSGSHHLATRPQPNRVGNNTDHAATTRPWRGRGCGILPHDLSRHDDREEINPKKFSDRRDHSGGPAASGARSTDDRLIRPCPTLPQRVCQRRETDHGRYAVVGWRVEGRVVFAVGGCARGLGAQLCAAAAVGCAQGVIREMAIGCRAGEPDGRGGWRPRGGRAGPWA